MGRSLTALYFEVQMGTKWLPEKGLVKDFSSRVSAFPKFGNIQIKEGFKYIQFLQPEIQCEVRFRNFVQIYLCLLLGNIYVYRCTEQDTPEHKKL